MRKFSHLFLSVCLLFVAACSGGSTSSPQLSKISAEEGRTAVLSNGDSIDLKWGIPGDNFEITHKS